MTDPAPLAWIGEARALMLAADASMAALAAWLGVEPAAGDGDRLRGGPGSLPGMAHVSVIGADGVPDSLSAWYAPDAGPTLDEAAAVLGSPREIARAVDGPFRIAFPSAASRTATCLLAGSTWDPPRGRSRIVEFVLRRDPLEAA
ncbi:hypothetical protein [Miltoncostaea marina]|uniref:hypothetical protein n=1 Tax=Miltoncostaea marina TaxID=2843215 RepID=UPI001C3C4791|nr:hypothetical protein [Miltoncostaea marina]